MVNKKEVMANWPPETGDFSVGDVESPIAVVTLGSHMDEPLINAGAAISGPLHTENLGIEKIVANLISNVNLRYLLICGSEVQGHITGQTMQALYDNGINSEKKNIIDSAGAIPFVENLTVEAVKRFQDQFTLINKVDIEDINELTECIEQAIIEDPGAYSEEAMVVELNKKENTETTEESSDFEITSSESINSEALTLLEIETKIRNINAEVKQVASYDKLSSGYYAGKIEGIVIGFLITMIFILLLIL